MARGTSSSTSATTRRERGSRASGRAAAAPRDRSAVAARRESADAAEDDALVTAALMGAAVGAGIGFLLSRVFATEPTAGAVVRLARDRAVRRGREQVARVADRVERSGRRTRKAFDDLLDREIASLRKVARRQRRRFGV